MNRDPGVREVSVRHGALELAPKRLGREATLDVKPATHRVGARGVLDVLKDRLHEIRFVEVPRRILLGALGWVTGPGVGACEFGKRGNGSRHPVHGAPRCKGWGNWYAKLNSQLSTLAPTLALTLAISLALALPLTQLSTLTLALGLTGGASGILNMMRVASAPSAAGAGGSSTLANSCSPFSPPSPLSPAPPPPSPSPSPAPPSATPSPLLLPPSLTPPVDGIPEGFIPSGPSALEELDAAPPDPTLAPVPPGGMGRFAGSADVAGGGGAAAAEEEEAGAAEEAEAEEAEEEPPFALGASVVEAGAGAGVGVGSGSSVYRSQKSWGVGVVWAIRHVSHFVRSRIGG